MPSPRRLLLVALLTAATAAVAGCVATTDPEPAGTVPIAGTWSYTGLQSGSPLQLTGAVDVVSRSTVSFIGSADLIEGAGGAAQRRLTGPVAGRFTQGAVVEFDLTLGVLLRRHVARTVADTIAGSWFELAGTDAAIGATGSFRAVRRR
ncbi:MAG: hypothetical protein P3C10_08105 [Gemmatimonadota bacterium]|nr:hypothetical protein [Gemmatimonadota bacterium]